MSNDIKRYEMLPDDTITIDGHTLHRIRCLVDDIPGVLKGELGGYIESEENLAQHNKDDFYNNSSWVFNTACVYGNAVVKDAGRVIGDAIVKDDSIIDENAIVGTSSIIEGNTLITSNAYIIGSHITGISHRNGAIGVIVSGHTHISNSNISGLIDIDCQLVDDCNIKANGKLNNLSTIE